LIPVSDLPTVNAALNSVSAVFLTAGYFAIRSGNVPRHRLCMLLAFSASTLFLALYLVYHFHVGSVPFQGTGWLRVSYFVILISHAGLAVLVVPFALVTLARALRGDFERHRRVARWALPLWLYVSVTGVVVYWMLYRL
jgi:uncharacterized membrane protein YozB (DUF420 family)